MASGQGNDARRPGRPPRQEETATGERILLAAIGLFAERGYAGAAMRDIAAAAGVTEGAIYRHYASKDAILDATLAEFERRVYQPLPPPAGGGEGFALGLLAALPRVILGDPVLLQCARFLLGEVHHNEKIRAFVVSRFIDQAEAFTAGLLRERFPDGRGLALSPEVMARVFNSLRFGWVFGTLIIRPPGDLATLEAELRDIAAFLDQAMATGDPQ